MPSYRDEILLIHSVITHPAGFNVDLFGDLVTAREHSEAAAPQRA